MTHDSAPGDRVLVVAPEPLYEDRGTPIAVRQVLQALSETGYAVDVVTYPLGRDFSLPGMRWFRCRNPFRIKHVPVGFSVRKVVLDVSLVRCLRARVRSERYLWIQGVEEAGLLAAWIGRKAGIPVVYDMQSSLPQQLASHPLLGLPPVLALIRRCERWTLRHVDLTIASVGLASYVAEVAPGAECREWCFPAAVRLRGTKRDSDELRRELIVSESSPIVMYTGTFSQYQGLPLLIDCAHVVLSERPETIFVLIGGTEKRVEELRDLVTSEGVAESFRILPRVSREKAQAFLDIADVAVSPRAYGDNLPIKVFDYMSAGRPTVATAIPGHSRALADAPVSLVPPNAAGLAEGILDFLRDPARAEALGQLARDFSLERCGWDAFVDSTIDHLRIVDPRIPATRSTLERDAGEDRGAWQAKESS